MRHLHFSLLFLAAMVGLFTACSSTPKPKVDTFGELDSLKVAGDTAMQVNMDRSYEYLKSLIQNDSIVFDFIAFDKPHYGDSKVWDSKFIVIRRTPTQQDTVIRGTRMGAVRSLGIGDINADGRPEIFFYDGSSDTKNRWVLNIYSQTSDTGFNYIYWRQLDARSAADHYNGDDTFFVYQNYLIRRHPYFESTANKQNKGFTWQSYKLKNGKILLEKESYAKE